MAIIKKIILLALTVLMMVGCVYETKERNQVEGFDIIVVDSCEYLKKVGGGGYSGFLAHKGNCRFCNERDSIKWEKRKKELEELVIRLKEK